MRIISCLKKITFPHDAQNYNKFKMTLGKEICLKEKGLAHKKK